MSKRQEDAEEKKRGLFRKRNILIGCGALLALVVLCGIFGAIFDAFPSSEATVTKEGQPTPTSVGGAEEPTKAAGTATNTPIPSATFTPKPTSTYTPEPTATEEPTPTSVPEPKVFEGTGDDVVELSTIWTEPWGNSAFLHIVGPNIRDNFIVYSYDMEGVEDELLVNTIGSYNGFQVLWKPISRLSIESGGSWKVEVFPIAPKYAHVLEVPGTYEGHDDDVIVLSGNPDLAKFKAPSNDNFIVYSSTETRETLLVNEIGPYSGTKVLPLGTFILEVMASGDWSVEVTSK